MRRRSIIALACSIVLATLAVGLIGRWHQQNKAQKIEFLLHQWQHGNEADLAEPELLRLLETCGATVTPEKERALISYRSFWIQQDWHLDLKPN